jgi:hypothetical protein
MTLKKGSISMKKKITAAVVSSVLATVSICSVLGSSLGTTANTASAESDYNYAEALQKSMFFYEVQQAGVLPDWNEVSWRADSMENDYVAGGWFDAGDHIKFALTNAYSSTILAWGYMQYEDAVKKAGLSELYLNNLQWGLDYVAGCDEGDKVVGTIADDAFDHVWWGSAEVYMRKYILKGGTDPRPYDEITCTSTVAQMASAMAAGYIVFKDVDSELADSYLEHAKSLFELADTTRSNDDQGVQKSYYNTSDFYDDLFYAANWMYMATNDQKYLDLCESDYIPQFATESQSTERKYTWGFCWDDASQAASLLYAINTGKDEWKQQVYKHLEYWTTGYGGKQVSYTPDGMAWLTNWGSLRHSTTTAFLAYIAKDTIFADDETKSEKYSTWAKSQMDYAFGDNDLGMSYVLGMGDKNPTTWHHRTSSGVWDDQWSTLGTEKEYAHTLYGALEGGPNQDGTFTDQVNSYQNTEVAIDYNAGFTGALCALIAEYGGEPLADFPETETPKWDEFSMKASINQAASSYTEIKAYALNHSAWPARVIEDLSYNYYFDISELIDAGYSIDDVSVKIGYDQHSGDEGKISISDPIQYDGTIYYVKLSFADGRVVMPTGQSENRSECQFRISIPDNIQGVWDASNDYSFEGLEQGGEDAMIVTDKITMYDGDTLIWGTEPDGTTPDNSVVETTESTTEATTEAVKDTTEESTTEVTEESTEVTTQTSVPSTDPTEVTETVSEAVSDTASSGSSGSEVDKDALYGDVNCDGKVDVGDVVLLNKSLVECATLSAAGKVNSDCLFDGVIDSKDALQILKFLVMSVDSLPVIE